MSYYFAETLSAPFDDVVSRTLTALQGQGFGVITEIDVKETLKKKLDIDFRRYRILGACNPALANEALQLEDKVGTMLPCNVIVQDKGDGATDVAAIDPVPSMQAIDNPDPIKRAELVQARFQRIIESL
jgi:uncharacterized protein (DUF302 family)